MRALADVHPTLVELARWRSAAQGVEVESKFGWADGLAVADERALGLEMVEGERACYNIATPTEHLTISSANP